MVVSRIFASWNQLDGWLREVEWLRRAASEPNDVGLGRNAYDRLPRQGAHNSGTPIRRSREENILDCDPAARRPCGVLPSHHAAVTVRRASVDRARPG
jgi:hypothetical protein